MKHQFNVSAKQLTSFELVSNDVHLLVQRPVAAVVDPVVAVGVVMVVSEAHLPQA